MKGYPPWLLVLIAFAFISAFSTTARAASPTSFCKCTCFGNSTIVPLDLPVNPDKKPPTQLLEERRSRKKTCNDCNRQFCLSYPFCKGEKEEKVLTTCFRKSNENISGLGIGTDG